jgi:hypothetical protein
MESRLSWSLSQTFMNSFLWWNSRYHEAFFFHTMEFCKRCNWGKTLFMHITKSIYIGSASLKIWPLDLEPPLSGKEYGPPYSKLSAKFKCFCSQNHL